MGVAALGVGLTPSCVTSFSFQSLTFGDMTSAEVDVIMTSYTRRNMKRHKNGSEHVLIAQPVLWHFVTKMKFPAAVEQATPPKITQK
jgi:hypothetical protein